jgi:hypothetical protein
MGCADRTSEERRLVPQVAPRFGSDCEKGPCFSSETADFVGHVPRFELTPPARSVSGSLLALPFESERIFGRC